jgi:uncharacterized protein YdaU (DUF1376 family)
MHYYQHHIGDYRKDTSHLSLLEHGIYRQLLDLYYITEKPLDAKALRLICARTDEEQATALQILEEFFIKKGNKYYHTRCDDEIISYHGKKTKAKASAEIRWNKNKDLQDANALPTDSESNANHKPITINHKPLTNNHIKDSAKETFALPDWVNEEHWNIWIEKNKKKTVGQKKLAVNKLKKWKDAGLDYRQALEDAAEGGWQGLHEPKQKGYTNQRDESRRIAASSIFTPENTKHLRTNQITEKDVFDA